MINNFRIYMKHGFGLSKSWRLAFGRPLKNTILYVVYWLLIGALVGLLISIGINKYHAKQDRVAASQKEYVQGLEKVVAQCLSDSTGRPITIDGKTYLCGIYSVGL